MKELFALTGGRYTYADDFVNLQDLALSITSIFDDCVNFIISGCEVSGTTVSEGYVYINKKIRRFSGATGVTFPFYIYEQNSTEPVPYANGQNQTGRKIFGCAWGTSVPSGNDPLTNQAPQYILFPNSNAGSASRIDEAFFGAKCLLLDSGEQTVYGDVVFGGEVTVDNLLTVDSLMLVADNFQGKLYYDTQKSLILQNKKDNSNVSELSIIAGSGFLFNIGSTTYLSVSESQITTPKPIRAPKFYENGTALEEKYMPISGSTPQPITDTGWVTFNNGAMHARQYGKTVGVYGNVTPGESGTTLFTLPDDVEAPSYDVIETLCFSGSAYSRQNMVVIKINQGEKTAQVLNVFISESVAMNNLTVSFTYMV